MKQSPWDTLIIGQGLAGSLLAWRLMQAGQRVLIIADPNLSSASRMAAGLINPVTGKRLVKSSQLDTWLPQALALYRELEQLFGKRFFHAKDMLRLFNSEETTQAWEKRRQTPDYAAYIGTRINQEAFPSLHLPLGGFKQMQTGYLDTTLLLDSLSIYFKQHDAIHYATVCHADIELTDTGVCLDQHKAQQLIFCEGHKATTNPWFSWLPFKLAKGEILTIEIDDHNINDIINAGHWLLPVENGLYKFGASYQWEYLDDKPNETIRRSLLDAAHHLLNHDKQIQIKHHDAGIRPCTRDTLPYVGMHPSYPQLGIFNGFGSKGSLLIPYYSHQFTIQQGATTIDMAEADIKRYWQEH